MSQSSLPPNSPLGEVLSTSGDSSSSFAAPEWGKNEDYPNCQSCDKGFSFSRRRHHCRACGGVFCDVCSKNRKELPEVYKLAGKQRVCDGCNLMLMQKAVEENPDEHAPLPDFAVVHANLVEKLKGLLAEPQEAWLSKISQGPVQLWAKKVDNSSFLCVRTQYVVKKPRAHVIRIYDDKDLWKTWQPDIRKCKTIEAVTADAETMYVHYKVPVVEDRDVVCYSAWMDGSPEDERDASVRSLMSTSIVHPLVPKVKGVTRALVSMCLTTFRGRGDGTTLINTYIHSSPNGLVPPMVVNQTITRATSQIVDMIKFMERTAEQPEEAEDE